MASEKSKKGTWTEGFGSLVLAIGVALFIRWALIEAYVIPSGSMLPTLLIRDHIFVNKFVYGIRIPFSKTWLKKFKDPERGEIIVFKWPKDESIFYIKRVVGLPGDKITYEDGVLTINDQKVETTPPPSQKPLDWVRDFELSGGKEEYDYFQENLGNYPHSTLLRKGWPHMNIGPITIPEGNLLVMGDNRDNSSDSRYWGFVPEENIIGRAMFVWLSCEETLPVLTFLCNPLELRWKRFFHVVHTP